MQGPIGRIVLGFIAAAISVVIVHEGIIHLLNANGFIPTHGWAMTPAVPPYGVPRLMNNIFWGGLWGALFGLVYNWVPGGMAWLKGLIFGLFIVVASNWILLPLIRGKVFGFSKPGAIWGLPTQPACGSWPSSSAGSGSASASFTD